MPTETTADPTRRDVAAPEALSDAYTAMLSVATSRSLSPRGIVAAERRWAQFERFGAARGLPVAAPVPALVLGFLSALRSGTAPGSSGVGGESLRLHLAAIRYRCMAEGWPDPTRDPLIRDFVKGAAREDADMPRRRVRPLEADTVRAVIAARPGPGVIALRGRVALGVQRQSTLTAGRLVRVTRDDIALYESHAVLVSMPRTEVVVLKALPDRDVCPVHALRELLAAVPPNEPLPLSVTVQDDGSLRFAESAAHCSDSQHVANPVANQVRKAVRYVGGDPAAGPRSLSRKQYEVAAWRMDLDLAREFRDEASLLLAWHTGMRQGALVGLRLGVDVHLDGDEVQVERTVEDRAAWTQVVQPSEDETLCAVRALRRWTRAARLTDGDFLFGPKTGRGLIVRDRPMGPEAWSMAWRRLAGRCEVDPAQLHAGSPRRGFIRATHRAGATTPRIVAAVGPFSAEAVARQTSSESRQDHLAGRLGL